MTIFCRGTAVDLYLDYNWDVRVGSPSFITEVPSDGLIRNPEAVASTRRYVFNLTEWLGAKEGYRLRRLDLE